MAKSNLNPETLMEILRHLEEYTTPSRLKGLYRAKIEKFDTKETDRNGRYRVRVFGVHDEQSPVDHLPWAEHCEIDGGGKDYGDHSPFAVGDTVYVMFEQGDPHYPVIMGAWRLRGPDEESEVPAECRASDDAYEKRRIFKSRYGHRVEISDEGENLEIVIRTGLYADPDYPQTTDNENVQERRITLRDTEDFGFQVCTPQGFLHMHDKEKKMTKYLDGDY